MKSSTAWTGKNYASTGNCFCGDASLWQTRFSTFYENDRQRLYGWYRLYLVVCPDDMDYIPQYMLCATFQIVFESTFPHQTRTRKRPGFRLFRVNYGQKTVVIAGLISFVDDFVDHLFSLTHSLTRDTQIVPKQSPPGSCACRDGISRLANLRRLHLSRTYPLDEAVHDVLAKRYAEYVIKLLTQ